MSYFSGFKTHCDGPGRAIQPPGRAGLAKRRLSWLLAAGVFWTVGHAEADTAVNCGGFAMLGGAQIVCSQVQSQAPTQFCTFSWALLTTGGAVNTTQGSFLLPPGASDVTVYQGAGFATALSEPIVLCQGKKSR
ncbi:hypothetical protein [Lichenifustis flavocetrariae]|uniref:Uncharacterized protein n=1 Tax=Lichenifustis flavocetrariae TaxID=2949735 RepID=A0AA41YRI7_9HYPH|nr:hypothetical protein [Lichenifustis flavocetrariae]MCW6507221.1 hypothetical protein [Lichenifustis flavocetrariae]